jgi:hypothetical protein
VRLTGKQWAKLNKMDLKEGIRGYEACKSQINSQKKKKQATYPELINQYSSTIKPKKNNKYSKK